MLYFYCNVSLVSGVFSFVSNVSISILSSVSEISAIGIVVTVSN